MSRDAEQFWIGNIFNEIMYKNIKYFIAKRILEVILYLRKIRTANLVKLRFCKYKNWFILYLSVVKLTNLPEYIVMNAKFCQSTKIYFMTHKGTLEKLSIYKYTYSL